MIRNLGPYHPRRPHKLDAPLLAMLLNGVHDRHDGRVFVLQIGAGTGQGGQTLLRRFADDGWSGLLIEPHPVHFEALEALHTDSDRVAVLNLGISDVAANLALHSLAPAAALRFPRIAPNRASLIRDRIAVQDVTDADLLSVEVAFIRLDSIVQELGIDSAHLIMINAGGHEEQVLRSFDVAALGPSLVLIHSRADTAGDAACSRLLLAAGLSAYRLGEWLVGLAPGALAVPLDELLTFLHRGVGQAEADA